MSLLKKVFTPWLSGDCFDDEAAYQDYLVRYDRVLNAVRIALFLIAAVGLILSYATDQARYNYLAAGVLVVALGLSLIIIQNEKQLPEELRAK